MQDKELIFRKIEAKEKEWAEQLCDLEQKCSYFEPVIREKIQEQILRLNDKLKDVEEKTNQLKKVSKDSMFGLDDALFYSWIELFTEIDNAMLKLK